MCRHAPRLNSLEPMATTDRVIAEDAIRVLDHGFVRLDDAMATDLSVVNAAPGQLRPSQGCLMEKRPTRG